MKRFNHYIRSITQIPTRRWLQCAGGLILSAGFILIGTALQYHAFMSPNPSLLLLDRNGFFLAQIQPAAHPGSKTPGYGYWPVGTLPERVVAATLTLEDKRFWMHPGVDPAAILRAIWQNITSLCRVSGASTIAMQVVRLQHPGPRTYYRKAIETVAALFMTLRYGRERVLQQYLRLVPYGRNLHGIAYASRIYFDKPVEDLSWAEIAFLCAIPHAPGRMNPFAYSGRQYAIDRGRQILDRLYHSHVMTTDEFNLGLEQIARITIPHHNERPIESLHYVLKLDRLFTEQPDLITALKSPRVFTTLDLNLQQGVDYVASKFLDAWASRGAANVSVIVTRRESREILAWLGSHDYFSKGEGAIDFTQTPRSPGSALKPFIYAQAFERGIIEPNTILDDLPTSVFGFVNADMDYLGPLLPRQALANSRNIPAINLCKAVGIDEVYLFWEVLGLHANRVPAGFYGSGLAIGGLPVNLEQLVYAYGALANDGFLAPLVFYHQQGQPSPKAVISKNIARLITLYLSDPMARLPSFPRMGTSEYPFPVAVKTGTSSGFRDAWTIAYSKDYLIGVWVGRADNRPMNSLGGSRSAASLAQKVLLYLHKEPIRGIADLTFPAPEGYEPVEICVYTGKRAAEDCGQTYWEWFPSNKVPEPDDSHLTLAVDTRNGLLATTWTPKDKIISRSFLTLPARYATWAKQKGISPPPTQYSPLDVPPGSSLPLPAFAYPEKCLQPALIKIHSPENGLKIIHNPEVPKEMNTLALNVSVHPSVPQALWYVDGKPFQLAEAPYSARWPLQAGRHSFQVKLPFRDESSEMVIVTVE